MGWMAMVMQGVGSNVTGIGGAADLASSQEARARNAKELERSAALTDAAAVDALRQGQTDAGRIRMRGSEMVARQRMAYAGSGVDVTTGTPVTTAGSTALISEVDAATTDNNAMRTAFGFREASRKYRLEAADQTRSARSEREQFFLGWLGGKLGTAGGMMQTGAGMSGGGG